MSMTSFRSKIKLDKFLFYLGIAKRATHSDDTKCSCVLTVPEFFDDPSREFVRNAATQAGWNVLQVVNAPSVTPFTYGINVSEPLNDT